MIVVSDTGPLIALAKMNRLDLLTKIFGQVLIPPSVYRELFAKYGPESMRLDKSLPDLIHTVPMPVFSPTVKTATSKLDIGEQQAIALAFEKHALLIIDDRLGRAVARRLGLSITGTVGVLIMAKKKNLLPAVLPLLNKMRHQGYWLSDEILAIAAKLSGEN